MGSSSTPQKQQDPFPMSIEPITTTSPPPSVSLLHSPSPFRMSRTRLEAAEESPEPAGARRRCKGGRGAQAGAVAMASPRKARKPRRRSEAEVREEKDVVEEVGKPRKRRNTVRSKKEKLNSVVPPSVSSSPSKAYFRLLLCLLSFCYWNFFFWVIWGVFSLCFS